MKSSWSLHGIERPHPSRASARTFGLLWILSLLIILTAGLWPFHAPSNDIAWFDKQNGLQFGRHGSVHSLNGFQSQNSSVSGTVEALITPTAAKGRRTILAFEGNGNTGSPFAIQQNGRTLIVHRHNVDETGKYRTAEIMVEDAFLDAKPVFVMVTLGVHETDVYLDGAQVKASEIQGTPVNSFSGRLVLGNAPRASDSWSGQISGLALYATQLPQSQVSTHFAEWTKNGGPSILSKDQPLALYKFTERQGNVARNEISSPTDLTIPSRYFVLAPEFLSSPLRHYHSSWTYWADFALNIAGFIPFGFFLFGYLSDSMATRNAAAITIAAGFATSLTIEVLQAFLPTRDSGMNDLFTNTFGTALGVMLFHKPLVQTLLFNGLRRVNAGASTEVG